MEREKETKRARDRLRVGRSATVENLRVITRLVRSLPGLTRGRRLSAVGGCVRLLKITRNIGFYEMQSTL